MASYNRWYRHCSRNLGRNVAITGVIIASNFGLWTSCSTAGQDSARLNSVADNEAKSTMKKVNPFDCVNPACSSKMDLLKSAMKRRNIAKTTPDLDAAAELIEATVTSSTDTLISVPLSNAVEFIGNDNTELENPPEVKLASDCPLDKEELGRSTWDLIHTIAAYYPDSPSDVDKENARNFISSVSYLYPCEVCREDFKESVAKAPPRVESREEFSIWCCRLHNEVNEKLGYEMKYSSCNIAALDERWLKGRKSCWDADD